MLSVSLLSFLAAALSAHALSVTVPNNSSTWSSTGSNTLSWDRVSTDATNFTVVLTNTDRTVMPTNDLILADLVDATSATSTTIQAPSDGYNPGGTYRVNLVKSTDELDTIYAQSDDFTIVASSSSASDSSTSGSSSATSSGASASTTSAKSSSGSSSATASSASASSSSSSSSTSGAGASRPLEFGLMGAALALGAVLA